MYYSIPNTKSGGPSLASVMRATSYRRVCALNLPIGYGVMANITASQVFQSSAR